MSLSEIGDPKSNAVTVSIIPQTNKPTINITNNTTITILLFPV
jgi:hypothetical protein